MPGIFSFFIAWYNLPFTTLMLLGLFLVALQLIGLGGDDDSGHADGDVDAHADLDHDVDLSHDLGHDLDHDLSHDLDHSVDHDVSHDVDHGADHDVDQHVDHGSDHDTGAGHSEGFSLLAFIGVGKTPLMVVLLILFASIGLLGWLLNGTVQGLIGSFPGLLVLVTLPVSIVAGTIFTSRVTRFIGQTLPPISTTASRAQAMVGSTGMVISPFVDEKYGMVHLRDQGGTLISVFAVSEESQPIPRGEQVLLVSYDAALRRYRVTRK